MPITSAGRFSPLGPRGMRLPRLFLSLSRNDNDAVGDGQVGGINPAFDLFFRQSRNLRRDHTSGVAFRRCVNPILKGTIRFKKLEKSSRSSPRCFPPSMAREVEAWRAAVKSSRFQTETLPNIGANRVVARRIARSCDPSPSQAPNDTEVCAIRSAAMWCRRQAATGTIHPGV